MGYQVCMACRDLLAHPAVMDETEPKATWAPQGRQRRQWVSSTDFIHELQGVCLEKTRRQGFWRNLNQVILVREEIYFTNSQRSTIFSP